MPVAAVPIVAAGLVALVFGWALWQLFAPLMRAAFSQVPVVGGFIVQQTDNLLWAVWRYVAPWANQALYAVHDLVLIPVINLGDVLHQIAANVAKLQGQHAATVHVRLPGVLYLAQQYAFQLAQQAINYAAQAQRAAEQYAFQLTQGAIDYSRRSFQQAIAFAQQLQQQAIAYASALSRQDQDYTQQLHADAIGFAQQLGAQETGFAEQLYRDATAYARALQQETIDYDGALHREAIGFAQQIGAQAEAYARALNGQAIAYAQATAGAVATKVTEIERSPCIQHCGPLGDLGSLLQGLEDLGLSALLVALLGEAVSNPGAVLDEARSVALPLVQDAGRAVTDLAGVTMGG